MVDLETLGNRPGCVILSIGAVAFGPDGLGDEFYIVLETEAQRSLGLHTEPGTEAWWAGQSAEARRVFTDPQVAFAEGLSEFKKYCRRVAPYKTLRMWGNGSDFDNAILAVAHAKLEFSLPWQFWNSRCYRTLKNLGESVAYTPPEVAHDALSDAKAQAAHAVAILNAKGLWPT